MCRRLRLSSIVLGLIFALEAVLVRWRLLSSPRGGVGLWSPLDPDAQTYLYYAKVILSHGLSAYANPARVPFWPITVAPFIALLGPGFTTIRVASFVFGLLTILATYIVAKEAFSPKVGLVSSFLLATSFYVVFDALRGLREELFSLLLLGLIYFALVRQSRDFVRIGLSAILTSLLYFTRSDGALLVVPLLLVYLAVSSKMRRQKMPVKQMFLIALAFAISIAGWAWYSFSLTGDPFAESTNYASWNYWVEFQKAAGSHPTLNVTMSQYLFQYHTISQLLSASAAGTLWIIQFLDMLLYPYLFGYLPNISPMGWLLFPVVPILFFAGAFMMWRRKSNWYFPFLYAITVPYLGLFHQLGVLQTPRALVPFAPIIFITISLPLLTVYQSLESWLRRRRGAIPLLVSLFLGLIVFAYISVNYAYLLAWATLRPGLQDIVAVSAFFGLSVLWAILSAVRKLH